MWLMANLVWHAVNMYGEADSGLRYYGRHTQRAGRVVEDEDDNRMASLPRFTRLMVIELMADDFILVNTHVCIRELGPGYSNALNPTYAVQSWSDVTKTRF
jgi:hypothetical protein